MQKVCDRLVEGLASKFPCFSLRLAVGHGPPWAHARRTKSIPSNNLWMGRTEVHLQVDLEGAIWFLIVFGRPTCSVPEMVNLKIDSSGNQVPNPQVQQAVGKCIQNPRVLQVPRNSTDFWMKKHLRLKR